MKWTIEYLEKDGIVAANINGIMDWEQHKKFAEELYPFATQKGFQQDTYRLSRNDS